MGRSEESRSSRGSQPRNQREEYSRSELERQSTEELRQLAGNLRIEGRERFDRDQLIDAIEREGEEPTRR